MKNERQITKIFLNSILEQASQDLLNNDSVDKFYFNSENIEDDLEKSKEEALRKLEKPKPKSFYSEEAANILRDMSRTPKTWSSVQQDVESFRNDINKRDLFSSTASSSQIGMASILLALFELVVETDLLIEPIDVNIIINVFKDNFKDEKHLEALKILAKKSI